jgi:hypothetical protein
VRAACSACAGADVGVAAAVVDKAGEEEGAPGGVVSAAKGIVDVAVVVAISYIIVSSRRIADSASKTSAGSSRLKGDAGKGKERLCSS